MADRLVVVGGDAGAMAAASQARRLQPDMDIVALEMGEHTSYSACGIPAVIGGDIASLDLLVARTPEDFRRMRIDMRTEHRVLSIDTEARTIEVDNIRRERVYKLGFDLLHLGTGATPTRPDIDGADLPHVFGVQTLADADDLIAYGEDTQPARVVVVGGGYIGLEMAEAFVKRGVEVTVIEAGPEVMRTLDADIGSLVSEAMRKEGITVLCGTKVKAISADSVFTDDGEVAADLVILGLGVKPNSALARDAGLAMGVGGSIVVDRRQATSAEGVYAAGDCCQSWHQVSGQPVHIALGTVANKMGRVAGINLAGGYATFPGVVGTAATKLCALEIARTGLNETEASAAGFAYVVGKVDATTKAGYHPGAAPITVKVLAEQRTGRLLGGQITGGDGSAKRIDVLATALTAQMTVVDVVGLDLAYAPPFSTVWDPVQIAARRALDRL